MKVYHFLSRIKKFSKPSAVTIGVFDGVHLGHLRLIKKTIRCAKKIGGKSVVFTFKGHPEIHLNKKSSVSMIKSDEAKLALLEKYGVDITVMPDFSTVRGMRARDFAQKVLAGRLNARCVVTGRDFIFGRGGTGDNALLKRLGRELGFKTAVVRDFKIKGRRVSSTLIRHYLKKGDVKTVKRMLGRPYAISGKVVQGRHAGFLFPTANIRLAYGDAPGRGVWAVRAVLKSGKYYGAANVGTAPTIKKLKEALLEVHILDFNRDIYGQDLRVVFLERIRKEKKFRNREELIGQVKKDIEYVRNKYL